MAIDVPLVSIIIPTYNEEKDIEKTLSALCKLTYSKKEIIVVDDSTDRTPILVKNFEKYGVKLLHREVNKGGRCGARNEGIINAKGEILIILNADILLPIDFIEKILPHYRYGADYVLVESEIANQDKLFGKYVEAQYHYLYDNQDWIEWTEGFSCKRNAAIKAGLFPVTPIPLVAGEDGFFGAQLNKNGFKKVIDRNIKVYPIVPDDLQGFWKCRKEKRSALPLYFLYKKSFLYLLLKEIIFTVYSLLYLFLFIPLFVSAFRLQRFSREKIKNLIPFIYCSFLERLAVISGGWSSIYKLFRYILKKDKSQ